MSFDELNRVPHRRFNPLLREWVLVSPHRTQRPWLGKVEKLQAPPAVSFDPNCYLCPGNRRAGGAPTPRYSQTYVFDNDYPAMLPDIAPLHFDTAGLLVGYGEQGICRVMCFSPRHDLTVPRMNPQELRGVVNGWVQQYSVLGRIPWIRHVQIFENRGEMMGASNPHPHCQIWANESLPNIPTRELASFREYRAEKHSCLLCDYLKLELELNERVVCQNDAFAVVVPFWAVWPFESLVLSKRHLASIDQLSGAEERDLLGDILRRITIRYDNLFDTLRHDSEIHGWLRTSRLPSARRHARARCGAPRGSRGDALPGPGRGYGQSLDRIAIPSDPGKKQPRKRLRLAPQSRTC